MTHVELHDAVSAIESDDGYRILRRVDHRDLEAREASDVACRVGLVVDVETTGLDPTRDKIIEFAARMFWVTYDGEIVAVGPSRSWLEDPGEPLSPEIARLTGLTDADLASRRIDDAEATDMLMRADFIVAHNAKFDRPFVERRFPRLQGFAWCCTCHDIDWATNGFDGRGLGWLLAQCGQFHDGHRAAADVDATIALLRHTLPNGRVACAEMLDAAQRPGWIVRAIGSNFDLRQGLKVRGYRWDNDRKTWWREVVDAALNDERAWLALNVYRPQFRPGAPGPSVSPITWTTRYAST